MLSCLKFLNYFLYSSVKVRKRVTFKMVRKFYIKNWIHRKSIQKRLCNVLLKMLLRHIFQQNPVLGNNPIRVSKVYYSDKVVSDYICISSVNIFYCLLQRNVIQTACLHHWNFGFCESIVILCVQNLTLFIGGAILNI